MTDTPLDPARTALLVMDFQTPIVGRITAGQDELLAAAASAIAAARGADIRVIYVVVGFRPGFPEIGTRNKGFGVVKAMGGLATDIDPRVAPQGDEPVVTKRRVGAFFGTDLDVILRAQDIQHLVLCGIATSGVVLSTLRHAADADYVVTVLRDACADADPDVHAALMDKVFPRQAAVIPTAAFVEQTKSAVQPSA